jgi:WD40 repeat protein
MNFTLIFFFIALQGAFLLQTEDDIEKVFQCELYPNYHEDCFLSWSPNDRWIATATRIIIKIDIWDVESGTLFRTLPTHADAFTWNDQGNLLAAVTEYKITIWDVENGVQIDQYDLTSFFQEQLDDGIRSAWPERFTSISWNNARSQIAIVTLYWSAVWDMQTGKLNVIAQFPEKLNQTNPLSAIWSPSGTMLALAFTDGGVWIYDSETFDTHIELDAHNFFANAYRGYQALTWSPDERYIAIGGIDAFDPSEVRLRIYDLTTGGITLLKGHSGPVTAVAWSPTGEFIASAGEDDFVGYAIDHGIRIWNTTDYSLFKDYPFEEPILSIAWNSDGTKLAAVDGSGAVYILEP